MASLILFAIIAILLPFVGVVILSTALLTICSPRSPFAAITCFILPAITVPVGLFALGTSSGVLRYSAQGPIIWFVVWPVILLATLGVTGAAFAVAAIRRRLIHSSRDGAATPTI